jgi:hypothetical protein
MCALAIGITKGLAKHHNETIEVTQTKCMHNGAPNCKLCSAKNKISAELLIGFFFFAAIRRTNQLSACKKNVLAQATASKALRRAVLTFRTDHPA